MNNNNQPAVIINFPETKIIRNIPTDRKKEILDKKFKGEIEELIKEFCDDVTEELYSFAPEVYDESMVLKDISLVASVLAAAICRFHNIPHPMHKFIDDNIKIKKLVAEKDKEPATI